MKKYLKVILLLVFLIITMFSMSGCFFDQNDYVDFSEYAAINPQELHNDYYENEIAAKEKYTDHYYYFTGTIHDITQYLGDNYLTIRYTFDKDPSKIIEFTAYFNNENDLKSVKKGDTVTVYGKFHQRSIENYMNLITSYSFKSCRIKND